MYNVKIGGPGSIVFRGKQVRLPATFNKVSKKDVKFLEVVSKANNVSFEILDQESERLIEVVQKIQETEVDLSDIDIEDTETCIEDLFEGDDTLGDMLKKLDEKE